MGIKDDKVPKPQIKQTNRRILILGQIEIRKLYLVSELYMLELFLGSASWAKDLLRHERNIISFYEITTWHPLAGFYGPLYFMLL